VNAQKAASSKPPAVPHSLIQLFPWDTKAVHLPLQWLGLHCKWGNANLGQAENEWDSQKSSIKLLLYYLLEVQMWKEKSPVGLSLSLTCAAFHVCLKLHSDEAPVPTELSTYHRLPASAEKNSLVWVSEYH